MPPNRFTQITNAIVIAILVAISALMSGCAGTTKEQRCAAYEATYQGYLETTTIREVSQNEVLAASAAAVFLRTYCGWVQPKEGTGTDPVDANGVPVIFPPQ